MQQKPVTKILIGILLVAVLVAVTQIQAKLDQEPPLSEKPETQVQTAEIPEETELEEAPDEPAEEKAVTEEFKDTVSTIIDNALGLFTKSDLEIVAIGDSLTQGVGDETDNGGYVGILENTLNESTQKVHIENFGKRGNRTDQLLKRLEEPKIAASLANADVILVTIGANDIMKVVKENISNLQYEPFAEEQKAYEDRLREIFDKMTEYNPEADIYLLGFFNPFESYFEHVNELKQIIDNWNSTSRAVTQDYEQVTYIPVQDLFSAGESRYFSEDNFHPNQMGYREIAERVFHYIRPSIEQPAEEEEKQEQNEKEEEEIETR